LFPTLSFGITLLGENGNALPGAYLKLGGIKPVHDSSLEVHALLDHWHPVRGESVIRHNADLRGQGEGGVQPEVRVVYNMFSTRYRGPYVGAFWRKQNVTYERATLLLQGDPAKPSQDVIVARELDDVIGIEAGMALSWRLFGKPLHIRVGVGGPIHRQAQASTSDGLRYYAVPAAAELRISAQMGLKSLIRRRHPLAMNGLQP
jgi:hypothetical protein